MLSRWGEALALILGRNLKPSLLFFFDAVVVVVVAERGLLEALTDEALVSALGSKITFEHDFQLGSLET